VKLLNTFVGLLGSRFLGRPFYARFHVTYRCNYRCGMCGVNAQVGEFPELPLDDVATVADRLWALGARHAVLTGGEPFLRRDLPEIVGLFNRRGFSVRIQTNGGPQVTREALLAVAAAGLQDLSVSVDTLDPALQDRICGGRGVLERACATLDLAREVLPAGMSLANIVASRLNFSELPALVEHFHRRGIYTYITPVMIGHNGSPDHYLFRSSDDEFDLAAVDAETRDGVIDALIAQRLDGWGLTNSVRHLEDFRRAMSSRTGEWQCDAGRYTIDVRPDGRVSPCKEKPPCADILAPDFLEVARSAEYRSRVAAATSTCSGCFYGEYREPSYAIRDTAVLREWLAGWLKVYHRGMRDGRPDGPHG
jgi:MoaA/NifB/PqqE/SkfB family radical SAM enzyme